ncbi:MAG: hypothetical protein CMO30_24635 [Tistrella sp.]|uniref:ArsR family transcriptional regulator n=1 Tax=Tistrella mobilis TaxID=171437 RepID=A0A3B9IDD0_9PROT|nr:hypothetical protein [Tistrella sp.]MAD35460.1 hypothetical protein [Tistrella sp.]MBA78467.1 hypothetical protein [Tistrella sp.]HAE45842.1 hypothetical protein [Tistrella mobilis]
MSDHDLSDRMDPAAGRRLSILRILVEQEGAANESVIGANLWALKYRGMSSAPDTVREDIEHLREAGLVKTDWYRGMVLGAEITPRGRLYLRRQVPAVPGVAYPLIGD